MSEVEGPTQNIAGELLRHGVGLLAQSSASPWTDAELLLAHALGKSREWLVAQPEAILSEQEAAKFSQQCRRRAAGEPIAYILGSSWFYGRELLVNEHVLIPRPETEHLIDEAVAFIGGKMRVLDVGTGSGAIACTIAAETEATVDATDISVAALDIARENARRCGVTGRVRYHHGDLAEPVRGRSYDVIVANLPYIPTKDLPTSPDAAASFEPREALDGGVDGLLQYRRLLPQLTGLVEASALILLECAPPTIEPLVRIARSAFTSREVVAIADYAGLSRYVKICS